MTRFDVVLASQWTTGAGADARTTSAGVAIGYDLTTGTLDTPTSYAVVSGGSGGTASAPSPDKSVTGSLPPINGVAQSIAVAGNGNSASNHATIDVGPGGTTGVVVPSGTACATCTVTIGGGGIGVQIAMPQGLASQTIDANGLAQSIRVASDFNAILNTLQLHVQTGNIGTAAFPPFALPPTFLTLGMH